MGFITANTKRMVIDATGNINISKQIVSYNGTSTWANGIPAIVGGYSNNGLTGAMQYNLFTPVSTGLFRVSIYVMGTAGTGTIAVGFRYTDPGFPGANTNWIRDAAGGLVLYAGDPGQGSFTIRDQAGQPIQFFVVVESGSLTYDVMATVEQLL